MRILHKSKRSVPPHPQVAALISSLLGTRNEDLAQVLSEITTWKWPRSDLNAWIKVLNKFDSILEDIVAGYTVNDLQLDSFSPASKRLLSEVLRFERLLLENSTNRKLFSSYDRLNQLLCTEDLDILILALNLLLRPAQQYSNQPSVIQALNISTPRLQSLCKRWPQLRDFGVSLVDLVSPSGNAAIDSLPREAGRVNFSFYRTAAPTSADQDKKMETDAAPNRGPTVVQIDEQTVESKPVMHILKEAIETYSIPEKEKFELMCRIRAAKALVKGNSVEREKYVTVRLLAIAIFGHTHPEAQAASSLFLYEPDVVNHVAELLQVDKDVPIAVQTAAIAALDALARYRSKAQEILAAVNAGVNHGILLALVRKTVADVTNADSTIPHSFIEALLSFITYIATHLAGGNMVVGAGLVPLLIQMIENKLPNRLPMVSKTMQLVDNVLYNFANAFQVFCAARGVEALVERIKFEIDLDIAEFGSGPGVRDSSGLCGDLPVSRAAILKHTLRSMHRMMQSSGTGEGLRGLIDSSILTSIKNIIEYRGLFGPSVLPVAINIMATFIHNEPTSLPTIQESGLPETFYRAIEAGVEPAIDVIQAIPNAIGALCLNEEGQQQLSSRPSIIPSIFSIFTSERHLKVLLDKENAVLTGTSMDELIRHHPSLKGLIFESIKVVMTKIEDMGAAWKAEGDLVKWYALLPKEAEIEEVEMTEGETPVAVASEEDVNMDESPEASPRVIEAIVEEPGEEVKELSDESSRRSHDNNIVSYIDVVNRFLEGLFQHIPHCRDFVTLVGGIERLGRFTSLPCLPYDFGNSVASDSMVQVMRTLAEVATNETLAYLMKLVKSSLDETKEFWETVGGQSKLLPLLEFAEEQREEKNRIFRSFITLHIRITLLSDVFATAGYSHGRGAISLLQTLMGDQGPEIVPDLGALHRATLCENLLFKTELKTQGIEGLNTPNASTPLGSPIQGPSALPPAGGTATTNGVGPSSADGTPPEGSTPADQSRSKDNIRENNAAALKHLSHGIPASLAPFFQALVKMFHARRNPDPAQKKQIAQSSKVLADVLLKHISQREIGSNAVTYSYNSLILGLMTTLLVDERTSTINLHTVPLHAFYNVGGFDSVSEVCRAFMASIATLSDIKAEDRTEDEKQELIHAYGGLKIALHLIYPIISSKPIFESGQTMLVTTPDKKDTDPDYFEPHNFLVKLRLAVVSLLSDIWTSEWLIQAPLPVTKSVVQTVLELINADNEDVKSKTMVEQILGNVGGIPRATPDDNRINQLVDMGFPRSAALSALMRTHNNVNAATELLLSHPVPFPPDPVPVEPEPPSDDDEVVEDAPSADNSDDIAPPQDESAAGAEEVAPPIVSQPPAKSSEELRKELEDARTPLRESLAVRALRIVDDHPQLIFDLHTAFVRPSNDLQKQSVRSLVDDVASLSPSAYDVSEQSLANRCQLLAWVMWDNPSSLGQDLRASLLEKLLALLLSSPAGGDTNQPALPKWLAAHLLCVEALLTLAEEPRSITLPKKDEPVVPEDLYSGPPLTDARNVIFEFSLRILAIVNLPTNELISILRLFVILTRNPSTSTLFVKRNGINMLLARMKAGIEQSCASYIAIILRHVVEDESTIQQIMNNNIKRYFTQPRPIVEISNYVRQCTPLALRDPQAFIKSTTSLCVLNHPYAMPHIGLKTNVSPSKASPHSPEGDNTVMQVDSPPEGPSSAARGNETVEAAVHAIIIELLRSGNHQSELSEPAGDQVARSEESITSDQKLERSHHQCFLMQCLTELLFSYESCKVAFLSYSTKKRVQTPSKDSTKHRSPALNFLLFELIPTSSLDPPTTDEGRVRVTVCNWAMSVVVALCVDTSSLSEAKDVSPDLVSVRKFVLDAISRAIKDSSSADSPESRYGRLLSLADLCYRLLTVKFNSNPRRQGEETSTHIAKIMLEKNFVAILTNAISEVDLNYPNVRSLVAAILKPLELLTKIAIKMSRTSPKTKEFPTGNVDSDDSYISDEGEDAEGGETREETPNLYRTSALGMYGGEMEDVHFDGEDAMDDDDEEDDEDVEMDYGEETGSEDTSNTDDEDEDELENATHESGEGWEDEEDEDDLVENDDDNDDDGDDGDEDDVDDEENIEGDPMWPNQASASADIGGEEGDDDDGDGVPIPIMHEPEDEPDMMSEDGEFEELIMRSGGELPQGFIPFMDSGGGARDEFAIFGTRRRVTAGEDNSLFFGQGSGNQPTPPENTTHPLLLDGSQASGHQASSNDPRNARQHRVIATSSGDILHTIQGLLGDDALQLIQHVMTQDRGGAAAETIRLDVPAGTMLNIDRVPSYGTRRPQLSIGIRLERHPRQESRPQNTTLQPLLTIQRWAEEVKMIHGESAAERVLRLSNHVILALLPAAIEAAAQAKLKEEEARAKAEAEAEKARAAEKANLEAQEKARLEAEEQKERERAEEEERAKEKESETDKGKEKEGMEVEVEVDTKDKKGQERPEAETEVGTHEESPDLATPSGHISSTVAPEAGSSSSLMPDAEMSDTTAPEASAAPQRVTVMIHGSAVDITDTGIDPTFLEALPDDMREEVLNQHVRDQRAARVERPPDSQISSEFLDALPPEIRAEIIQQERVEQARRRAEQAAPNQGPADIDPASFIASLDPHLREVVLLDQEDGFLQTLPSHILAEAGAYQEGRLNPPHRHPPIRPTSNRPDPGPLRKPVTHHDAIQLLEKSGLATLVRLLFFPQVLKKNLLFKVLVNLCENVKTRTELFNILLGILQDGTGDLAAVDKSFAQMSVKATKSPTPKSAGKQRVGPEYTTPFAHSNPQNDPAPELIAQRCLEGLSYIVTANETSSLFFLTESELPAGLRKAVTRKGKGKEKLAPQTHFPVVLLLGLLDRQSLLKMPSIMESVVSLLATVTRPLATLKESPTPPESKVPAELPTSSNLDSSSTQPSSAPETASSPPATTATEQPADGSTSQEASTHPAPDADKSGEKAVLTKPPTIPHAVLRLIVNILTTGECSGRTFQQSLALIQHLSYIPDARDVIANELKSKAQEFGLGLHPDLEELSNILGKSDNDVQVSAVASRFSAPSSIQANLLRVLKTIDYMYTPRSSTESQASSDAEKVQAIYESFHFTSLWSRLSDCLKIVEEKPETEHIATILLPLIEALMVVCKHVGTSTTQIPRTLRATSVPKSPIVKDSTEDLFVTFTDTHRKLLNIMVRNNPSLMSGSFSLLVNNPRVLDFDNKRNYFNQQLHRRPHAREHHGTLQLSVRRARVFEDSFQYLQRKSGDQIKYGKLSVRFYDEEGVDAGGVTREWFQILARQMFDPNNALFQPCAADRLTYQPNKNSWVNPEHLSFFKFVGRIIGKAIYDGRLLDAYFARSLYRQILGKPVDYKDVEWVDPEYYNSLCWILENDPTPLELTFSVEADEFGVNRIIPLKEGGETIPVTLENRREFVQLSAQYRLYSSIKEQIENLLAGFYEIIPKDLITIFNEQELELLISGTPDIDVDEWRAATEYNGYTSSDPAIVWWWRALKSFNREERAKVLSFATGTSRVPLGGFVELQGVQGTQRFCIHRAYGEPDRLPQAHTCFNQVDLPQYSSYEMLRQQLLLAITEGGEGFAFA
ncbi:E3 ubiquitin-protein ligase tom1 [Pleurotus ostreatus]|nr:E3 ubiquitin-protein ligase tom1 [Pleurotus ostreatus]